MSAACLWSNPREAVGHACRFGALLAPPAEAAALPLRLAANVFDSPHQESQLIARCLAADPAAWEELVRLHSPRVYNLCLRFTGSPQDAEDLTQEVFVRLYRSLSSYRPESGSFTAWLTALTRNLLVDHYRRSRHLRQTSGLDDPGSTVAATLPAAGRPADRMVWERELRTQIEQALVHLSPELREAIILRDLQDMDYAEIAAALRLPLGTVKSRINRGRIELARLLRPRFAPAVPNGDPKPPLAPAPPEPGESSPPPHGAGAVS